MQNWKLYRYDVWGNAEDGYEVNDRWCIGNVTFDEDASNAEIQAMVEEIMGFRLRMEWQDEDLITFETPESVPVSELCLERDS